MHKRFAAALLSAAMGMPTFAAAAVSGYVIVEAKSVDAAKTAAITSRRLRETYGEGHPIVIRSSQGDLYRVSINDNDRCIRIVGVQPAEGGKWRVDVRGSTGTNRCP